MNLRLFLYHNLYYYLVLLQRHLGDPEGLSSTRLIKDKGLDQQPLHSRKPVGITGVDQRIIPPIGIDVDVGILISLE